MRSPRISRKSSSPWRSDVRRSSALTLRTGIFADEDAETGEAVAMTPLLAQGAVRRRAPGAFARHSRSAASRSEPDARHGDRLIRRILRDGVFGPRGHQRLAL